MKSLFYGGQKVCDPLGIQRGLARCLLIKGTSFSVPITVRTRDSKPHLSSAGSGWMQGKGKA